MSERPPVVVLLAATLVSGERIKRGRPDLGITHVTSPLSNNARGTRPDVVYIDLTGLRPGYAYYAERAEATLRRCLVKKHGDVADRVRFLEGT
jgi:hypothetical protein